MKKLLILPVSVFCVISAGILSGQSPYEIAEEYDGLQEYIQGNLENYEWNEKEYFFAGEFGIITTYYDGNMLKKMLVTFETEGAFGMDEYYYEGGDLLLIVSQWETYPIFEEQLSSDLGVTEQRYYFHDNRMIKWTIIEQRDMDPRDPQFSRRDGEVVLEAEDWLRFSESEYYDFDEFLEEGTPPDDRGNLPERGGLEDLPEEVIAFLEEVVFVIEEHMWDEFLRLAESNHYRIQVEELGMSRDQYIKELLGLGFVGTRLEPAEDSDSEYPSCDRIREVVFENWWNDGYALTVMGVVIDDSGNRLELRVDLLRTPGGIVLTGALG